MRRTFPVRALTALAVLAVFLNGCNGSKGTGSPVPPVAAPPPPTLGQNGFVYDAEFLSKSHFLKPADLGAFGVDLVVKPKDLHGLNAYAVAVSVKGSPVFGRFLKPEEIADRFLASATDYAAARKYLERFGLKVTGWKQRYLLHASGTQHQLERALNTKFGWYQHRSEQFFGPMTAPHVPASVPIVGSPNVVYRTKEFRPSLVTAASNGVQNGYSPQQLQNAFDYAGIYNLFYFGTGITIGILGSGPVSLQGAHHIGDLEAMRSLYHAQGTNTIALLALTGGSFSTPPAVTAPCTQSDDPNLPPSQSPTATCNPEDGIAQAMTEQSALLAPGATIAYYLAYEKVDPNTGHSAQGVPLVDDELSQVVNDNAVDVLLVGFGASEPSVTPQEFALRTGLYSSLAAAGVSVFAASGDNGAYACQDGLAPPQYTNDLCVSYPASDQNVTAVGGVTTPLNGEGQFIGPVTAWGETTAGGLGGTGGGLSLLVRPAPAYQSSNQNPQYPNAINGSARNVPDIALEADPHTGVATVMNADPSLGGRQIVSYGGTTVAASEMAAMWALIDSVCKAKGGGGCPGGGIAPGRTGNAAPTLYPIYAEHNQFGFYEDTFLDVLYGTTGQCPSATCPPTAGPTATFLPGQDAGQGYDLTTGIGVPFARALLKAVSGT